MSNMNEMLWTSMLDMKLDTMDIFNKCYIVVHSIHRNKVTFELRCRDKNIVVFGSVVNKNPERVRENLEAGLHKALDKMYEKLKTV